MLDNSKRQGIPKNIVQYWSDESLPEDVVRLTNTWPSVYTKYNYQLFNRTSAIDFLKNNYTSEVVDAFISLKNPAMQSDLFRAAYLFAMGGIYIDVAYKALRPIEDIIDLNVSNLYVFENLVGGIWNGFIITPPANQALGEVFERILSNINAENDGNAYEVTGAENYNAILNKSNSMILDKHKLWHFLRRDSQYVSSNYDCFGISKSEGIHFDLMDSNQSKDINEVNSIVQHQSSNDVLDSQDSLPNNPSLNPSSTGVDGHIYQNALIIPQTIDNNIGSAYDSREFGVINSDLNASNEDRFPALHYRGSKSVENPENLSNYSDVLDDYERLEGHWFYGGILNPHPTQFFSESIHRLKEYIENPLSYDGIVFLPTPFQRGFEWIQNTPNYIKYALEDHFNISFSKIKWVTEKTVVDKLTVYNQHASLGSTADKDYLDFLSKFVKKDEDSEFLDKKYILAPKNNLLPGRCLGIDYIYNKLNEFEIINLEDYSFDKQIQLFMSAKVLIIEEGSGNHLLDWIGFTEATVILLSRLGGDGKYWMNMYQNKCKNLYVFDQVEKIEASFISSAGPTVLSISKFVDILKLFTYNEISLIQDSYYQACIQDINNLIKTQKVIQPNILYQDFKNLFSKINK